jgi:hypothetical protein
MLIFGQERSRENAALAAEPGCNGDSKVGKSDLRSALVEFQGRMTTHNGGGRWPVLEKLLDLAVPVRGHEATNQRAQARPSPATLSMYAEFSIQY